MGPKRPSVGILDCDHSWKWRRKKLNKNELTLVDKLNIGTL